MSITNNNQSLGELFKTNEGPQIVVANMSTDSAALTLVVPDDLSWFDGHFPDHKVLPGVVQIDWAGKIGKALFISDEQFCQLTNIKFKSMVLPGTEMELTLQHIAEKGVLKFHFFNESESFSTGSFNFNSL